MEPRGAQRSPEEPRILAEEPRISVWVWGLGLGFACVRACVRAWWSLGLGVGCVVVVVGSGLGLVAAQDKL